MSLALYMDVHMRRAVIEALRERRVDVLTAQADGTTELLDPALLDRAAELRFPQLPSHTGQFLVGGDIDDFELLGVKHRIGAE